MISAVITAKLECFVFGYFCVTNSAYLDVTRLGDFWYFMETKILSKVSQIFGDFLGYFENIIFM